MPLKTFVPGKNKNTAVSQRKFFFFKSRNPLIPSFYHTRVIKPTSSQTPAFDDSPQQHKHLRSMTVLNNTKTEFPLYCAP
jgi:hypothetical protein